MKYITIVVCFGLITASLVNIIKSDYTRATFDLLLAYIIRQKIKEDYNY